MWGGGEGVLPNLMSPRNPMLLHGEAAGGFSGPVVYASEFSRPTVVPHESSGYDSAGQLCCVYFSCLSEMLYAGLDVGQAPVGNDGRFPGTFHPVGSGSLDGLRCCGEVL